MSSVVLSVTAMFEARVGSSNCSNCLNNSNDDCHPGNCVVNRYFIAERARTSHQKLAADYTRPDH